MRVRLLRLLSALCCTAFPAVAGVNPRLEFAKGLLDEARGKSEEASQRFEAARVADPTALPLVRRRANELLEAGRPEEAAALYRDLATATPDRIATQLNYADFLRESGRGEEASETLATEVLEKTLKRFPGSTAVLQRLFRSSEARGDREKSLELFENLISQPPLSPNAAMMAAEWSNILFPASDVSATQRLDRVYDETFAKNSTNAALARAASEHYRQSGRLSIAIDILRTYTNAVPANLTLRTRLGILQFSARQYDDGLATLNEVLSINDRQALAHESLAKFYRQQDQPDLARPHADSALKIRGGSPAEFIALADEWLEAGEPKPARILLEKAAYDHPENPIIAARLAIATHRDPETRKHASRLFRTAESLLPEGEALDPGFSVASADAMIDEGRLPAAEERLRNAIRAFPPEAKKETAEAMRQLADLWDRQQKNTDAARSLRSRAEALDPASK